jgi:hypothetical protein
VRSRHPSAIRPAAAVLIGGLLAALVAAVPASPVHATVDDGDASCDCVESGPYQEPIPVADPFITPSGASAESGARYEVDVTGTIPGSQLTVTRIADSATVLTTSGDLGFWGFSPDQDRFVVTGLAAGLLEVHVYDLTAATPSASVIDLSIAETPSRLGFSPHGEFFSFTSVFPGSSDTVTVQLFDARTGDQRHSSTYTYFVPGMPADNEFGEAGYGFSPDDDEFLSMHVSSASAIDGFVVDLDSGVARGLGPLTGTGLWRFSPCGSVLALALQTNPTTMDVSLRSTSTGTALASASYPIATPTFATTATHHVVTVSGTTYELAVAAPPTPDVCPPTWPIGTTLSGTPAGPTSVDLTWSAAEDPSDVDGYRVYRGAVLLTTLSGATLTYTATGLSPQMTYTFRVEAKDTLGRWSTTGPTTDVTTPDSGPYWPSGSLALTDVDGTEVDLVWTAAQDDVAVTGYRILRNGVELAVVGAAPRSYADTTVARGTTYTYQVQARDADGNESLDGPQASVTTTTLSRTDTATLAGQVFRDLNGDGLRNGADSALALNNNDLTLVLYRVDGEDRIVEQVPAFGNPDGTWSTELLTPGTYVVHVMTYNVFFAGREQYRPAGYAPYRLEVLADAGWAGVEFALSGYLGVDYPTSGNGSITGVVFNDLDADGVRDPGEPGLAGVNPTCARVNTSGGPDCAGLTTGGDGVFVQSGLAPSSYRVDGPYGATGWFRTSLETYLVYVGDSPGQAAISTGEWGLVQGLSTITGTAWWDKDADGVKEAGEPVLPDSADLRVCVASPLTSDCMDPVNGAWSFTGLPPGTYDVTFEAPSWSAWQATYPLSGASLQAVVSANGSTVTVSPLGADGEVGTAAGVVFSDNDADGVRDAGEAGISGIEVCARLVGAEDSTCVTTGTNGTYAILAPAGTVRVDVDLPPDSGELTTPEFLPWEITVVDEVTTTLDIGYSGLSVPPPSAPTGLSATPGRGAASLRWTASTTPPAAPVTDYIVERSAAASGPWTRVVDTVSPATTATVTGLTNGVRVYLRVSAVSSAGRSTPSAVTSVVPRTVPGAVRSLKVRTATRKAYVRATWVAPSSNGGAAISSYQVQSARTAKGPWTTRTVSASSRALLVKGRSGRYVYVRVRAVNVAGYGPWTVVRRALAR